MIYSVRGKLIHIEPNVAVVECGGVGMLCKITVNTARQLPSLGNEVMLYTYMSVREDAMDLFGFADTKEMTCFKQLTTVSGVGAKVGIAILSELTPERVALAIAAGDYKALTKAAGVGPKLAQRIVLELKDKCALPAIDDGFAASPATVAVGNAAEAVSALTVLGFSASEAAAAVGKLDETQPVETLVRLALRSLAGK